MGLRALLHMPAQSTEMKLCGLLVQLQVAEMELLAMAPLLRLLPG